jgi:hypothetical protein
MTEILQFLLDVLLWVPRKLIELVMDGLATVIEAIPLPAWLDGVSILDEIPEGVAFFAEAFLIPEGVTILVSAYVIRFLIRRLPIVG